MHRAQGTNRLAFAEGAFVQPRHGVILEGAAFNAYFSRMVIRSTVHADHRPDGAGFPAEARQVMLSTHNILQPSNGEPVVAPTLDMVMGCYYLTEARPGARGA